MNWTDLLRPLTPLYAAAVRARTVAYGRGWLPVRRLEVAVVSVGNLTFGGTGKTPTTIALVRDLVRRGRRPAVLSRGYGRRSCEPLVVVGPEPGLGPELIGDEPLEMARRLPGVPIVVDADRVRGGRAAIGHRADTVILDDGFQHLRLARDLDLVVVDAGDPFGGGLLPPRGRLREPLTAVKRASAVVVSKLSGDGDERLAAISARVAEMAPALPVFGACVVPRRVQVDNEWRAVDALAGARVLAFAGIGRPQSFVELLEAAGAEVVGHHFFADHHLYTDQEIDDICTRATALGATPVTTAKDSVKIPAGTAVSVVEVDVEPVEGSWDRLWRLLPEVVG
jgi:tetraacyldisaccharide 4'-kinase